MGKNSFYKKVISLFIAAAVIVTAVPAMSLGAATKEKNEFIKLEPSEEFLEYSQSPEDYQGMIPSYFSQKDLSSQSNAVSKPQGRKIIGLPAKYDSRDSIAFNPIKDQSRDSTCAYFSMLGNFEILTSKTEGTNKYSFSEYHAKHATAKRFADKVNYNGFGRTPSDGTSYFYIMPYLINGQGPVSDSNMPYKTGDTTVDSDEIESMKPLVRANEIQVLAGLGEEYTQAQRNKWINDLKELIVEYGSVSISLTSQISDSSSTYFYNNDPYCYHDHGVVAVGWDDTIPAGNFRNFYDEVPSTSGGIIIRNSWGGDVADEGYGYVSFDSANLCTEDAVVITDYRETIENEETMTYSELGINSAYGGEYSSSQWFGSKFYLAAQEYVALNEVTFYALYEDMDYEVYLSPNGSTDRSKFIKIDQGRTEKAGYYTSQFDEIVLGSGNESEYFVVVKVYTPDGEMYCIPTEGDMEIRSYYTMLTNLVVEYVAYRENGVRKVVPKTIENMDEIERKSLSWWDVPTSFMSMDNEEFEDMSGETNIVLSVSVKKVDDYSDIITRFAGRTRYDTAVAISDAGWENADTVVLANASNFADALSGVSLAAGLDAPILLTEKGQLESSVRTRIQALNPQKIILLGGTAAIGTEIETELKQKYEVVRLGGQNRFATSAIISNYLVENVLEAKPETVFITNGMNFADALAVSPYAGMKGYPVLYAQKGADLYDEVEEYLSEGITNVVILGGEGAVDSATVSKVKNLGIENSNIKRLYGQSRYDTAMKIVREYEDEFGKDVIFATGTNFPDALAGGVLAAKYGVPLILTGPTSNIAEGIVADAKNYIQERQPENFYILGGENAVPNSWIISVIYNRSNLA